MPSLGNLLYENWNPNPANICGGCRPFIGQVFPPELALPLPAHPNCYCLYTPTDRPATVGLEVWDTLDEAAVWHWVLLVAYLLRIGAEVPRILRSLIDRAREYNEGREEELEPIVRRLDRFYRRLSESGDFSAPGLRLP